ncbi:MAG: hypothetical protein M3075_06630 [Candidatus Dormibacteraeota bacterium]|nr:hypothetical protein [Candidatus Dormibacteraeota bacterium]
MTAPEIETAKLGRRQVVRRETHHVLRRGGLIGAEQMMLLARAEGLSDQDILRLVRNWDGRRWPRK